MQPLIPEQISQFARAVGPTPDDVIEDMDAYADEQGFPTVGPEVGGWLSLLAQISDAHSVFEFGSGFGYSAYWFAQALSNDDEIVLTERDSENLDRAREYLSRGGYLDRVTIEQGDAIEIIEQYGNSFDIVLLDNEKHRYREAFETVREKVAPGGLVIADNAMTTDTIDFDTLSEMVRGHAVEANDATRGIAEYLDTVTNDPAFETTLLPLGEGVAVSYRSD
jgi:caffeoyl-CoA O-methyltransferase